MLGDWDRTIDEMPDVEAAKRVPLFRLSGANGGETLAWTASRRPASSSPGS